MNRYTLIAVLALAALMFGGCDVSKIASSVTPKEDDQLARQLIEDLRTGQLAFAGFLLDGQIPADKAQKGLGEIEHLFDGGQVLSIQQIGFFERLNWASGKSVRSIDLTYEVHLSTGWFVGRIVIVERGGNKVIEGVRFARNANSLEEMNRLTFSGKKPWQIPFLLLTLAVVVFDVWTLVVCLRSRIRKKWLWALFIVMGVGMVSLNWTTGGVSVRLLYVQLLAAGGMRLGLYSPWVFSVSVPLGAIVFLSKRRQLIAKAAGKRRTEAEPPLLTHAREVEGERRD